MSPVGKLVRRVHRLLVLLVVACDGHASAIVVQRVHRHALIDIIIGDLQLACELDVIVSELADLDIVDTKSLLFLSGTQTECRQEFANEVECGEDQACANEGVCAASEGVSELIAELDPVVVQPATGDDCVAVEVSNVITTNCQLTQIRAPRGTYAAKKAVRMLPMKPPTPWTAKMSRASSQRRKYFSLVA